MEPVTGIAIVDWLLGLLDVAGYPIVFGITIFENLFVIGGITPGETVVVAAAFLSSPQYGSLHWPLVWIASVTGTVIGSNISYFLGRKGGRDALLRYGHRFHISEKRIGAAEEYFARYGSKTVLIGRFTAGVKSFTPMIAGVSRMKVAWFELYTVLGAMLYTTAMVLVGYFLGENFERAMAFVAGLGYLGMAVFVVFVLSLVVGYRRRRVRRRLEEELAEVSSAAEIRRQLGSGIWTRIETRDETGSTNSDAVALARDGAPHGTVVLASRQTAGRGRLGREWDSAPGGVYVSAVMRPDLPPAKLTAMPLAVAVGVARAIIRLGDDARVKWPNDVLLPEGKVAGVLLELSAKGEHAEWLVIGVGLNVRRTPGSTVEGAAYLQDDMPDLTLTSASAAVLDGIAEGYQLLAEGGAAAVREMFAELDALRGTEVTVRDRDNGVVAQGRAAGIDDSGRLLVEDAHGEVTAVSSGDVTLRDASRPGQGGLPA